MKSPLFLFGYRRFETDQAHAAALLNLCLQESLTLTGFETTEDGNIRFCVGLRAGRRLFRACRREGVPVRSAVGGFPRFFLRFLRRKGLIAGLAFGIFLLILSQKFVWSVRITGNERMTAGEIRQTLAKEGLEVGGYLPRLNLGRIETQTLLDVPDLSWIAIYMDGTVANVQVTERAQAPENSSKPANLIAARDGQIEELELYRGNAVVKVGDPVLAGELLVSGVYDSQTLGYRFTRAAGRVLARTEREICIEIPLFYEEKVYEKSIRGKTVLQFFKFSFNFFKNSRKAPDSCDIIEVTTGKDWLGLHDLPVSLSQTVYRPYVLQTVSRTAEEALEQAYGELEDRLGALSPEIQLLEKRISTEIGEQSLLLKCKLVCVENIAVQEEFEINEP